VHVANSKNTFAVPPTRSDVAAAVSQARELFTALLLSFAMKCIADELDSQMLQPLVINERMIYLRVQFSFGAILAHQEGARFVWLHSALRKLRDLELVRVTHRRRDVNFVRRVRDVLIVEFDSHPVFA